MTTITRERGITTPQIQIQQVDTSQASVTEQVSTFALKTADVLADKANKKYELDFKNMAAEGINDAYQRNQNNPQQLDKELKSLRSGLVKNSPWSMRDDFDSIFAESSRPYMNKATEKYSKKLTDEVKFSSLKNLDLMEQNSSVAAEGLFSGNPALINDSQKAFQHYVTEGYNNLTAVGADGMPVFSPEERFKRGKDFKNNVAFNAVAAGYEAAVDKTAYANSVNSGELQVAAFINEDGTLIKASVRDAMDKDTFTKLQTHMSSDISLLKKQAKESVEVDYFKQLENQKAYTDMILDTNPETAKPADEKLLAVNTAQMKGEIPDEAAVNMRRYITSEKTINAVTNSKLMGEVITQVADVGLLAETDSKGFLRGMRNIEQKILTLRADGTLTGDDEVKLNNQIRVMTSSKMAGATAQISYSFGEANKLITSQLPEELRGEATRKLFYATDGEKMLVKTEREKIDLQAAHKQEATKIIDAMNLDRRTKTLENVQKIITPLLTPDDEAFLKTKGFTMQDIEETAVKHNMSKTQVIARLRAK